MAGGQRPALSHLDRQRVCPIGLRAWRSHRPSSTRNAGIVVGHGVGCPREVRWVAGPLTAMEEGDGAAAGNQQVKALVFVDGWMPDEGESIQQVFEAGGPFAGSLVAAAIRPVPFTNPDGSEGVDLWLDRELFPEAFCADVDPETATVMAATQRPWSGAGYACPSGPRGGGRSRRGTCWAPRTGPSRRRGSGSWPSAPTPPSRRSQPPTPPWCPSPRP
jgi:hypothetical protein